jgi:hypothetical protein
MSTRAETTKLASITRLTAGRRHECLPVFPLRHTPLKEGPCTPYPPVAAPVDAWVRSNSTGLPPTVRCICSSTAQGSGSTSVICSHRRGTEQIRRPSSQSFPADLRTVPTSMRSRTPTNPELHGGTVAVPEVSRLTLSAPVTHPEWMLCDGAAWDGGRSLYTSQS